MSLALLPLLFSLNVGQAFAQAVSDVPSGVPAVTVFVCDRSDGCGDELRAMSAWCASLGLPLLDFDAVASAGPGGRQALDEYADVLEALRGGSTEVAARARELLRSLPFTVSNDDLFRILMGYAHVYYRSGNDDGAREVLYAAASASEGRVHDLPELPQSLRNAYLDAVEQTVTMAPKPVLDIRSPLPDTRVFVDGRPVGVAPLQIEVLAGFHRISAEHPKRRTAWVGEVDAPKGARLEIVAQVNVDDGTAALEAAVQGATRGVTPDRSTTEQLQDWARVNRLRWVHFVSLVPGEDARDAAPSEYIPDPDPQVSEWAVLGSWLDAGAGRFTAHGPGERVLRAVPRTSRFRLGAGLGYFFLAPRSHAGLDIDARIRLNRVFSVTSRVGVMRSGDPYYLFQDWVDPRVFPVTVGLLASGPSGPYAGLAAVAVVPYALGGEAILGWEFAPSTWWRIGIEGTCGYADHGGMAGGMLRVAKAY